MGKKDARTDAYIGRSAEFARPVLSHIRELVHTTVPEIEEAQKWGMPFFTYKGDLICNIASFKEHCALSFWNPDAVEQSIGRISDDAMGQFGKIATLSDLPDDTRLVAVIQKAVELAASGVKPAARSKTSRSGRVAAAEPDEPADLKAALSENEVARTTFDAFSRSHRREYIEWISEAKREQTRVRRIATAIEWLSEGKKRNWKSRRS